MTELISRREFAKRVGVSDTAVRKALKEGRISLTDGKLDYESALEEWNQTRGPGNNNRFGDLDDDGSEDEAEGGISYFLERALLTRAQRIKTEMEVMAMRGELHYAEDVEAVTNSMISAFRARALAIPSKAALLLRGKTSLSEIQEILTRHIHECLEELSAYDPDKIYQAATRAKRKVIKTPSDREARPKQGGEDPPPVRSRARRVRKADQEEPAGD